MGFYTYNKFISKKRKILFYKKEKKFSKILLTLFVCFYKYNILYLKMILENKNFIFVFYLSFLFQKNFSQHKFGKVVWTVVL